MDTYEVLYTDNVGMSEVGDVIRFPWLDDDLNEYDEVVRVKAVDFDDVGDGLGKVIITGYSEVLNDNMEYPIDDDVEVEVLGG